MQKIINTKAKAGLKSNTIIWNLDAYYFKSHRLFYIIFSKIQIQNSNNKNISHSKKSKYKDLKLILPCNNAIKPVKKKDKKRDFKSINKNTNKNIIKEP